MSEPITQDMFIQEIIQKHPETIEVFRKYNLDCMSCQIAEFEEISHGAKVHKIDPYLLISELNSVVKKTGGEF